MNQRLLVLSQDLHLFDSLQRTVGPQTKLVPCDSIHCLGDRLASEKPGAVLVHLEPAVMNGYSAARFVAELEEIGSQTQFFGLAGPDCPADARALAEQTLAGCLSLPLDAASLHDCLSGQVDLERELEQFWKSTPHHELHGKTRSLVTFSPAMFGMLEEIKVAAKHKVTSLLIGETGSGKTFLARLIHELSGQREERFCTVACGALPPDLIESELFGYVKGAFTGADRNREGKFAAAGKGTLLLDEIDVLPPEQQAKLLRVIETGEYEPVGSNETQHSQARLIVASNYNLEQLVQSGNFRTDLYYRLNILNFRLPPLRERPLDIEYLAQKFALEHGRTHGINIRAIEPGFLRALRRYPWPGNVREMENVIRRAVLYCQRGVLCERDLPSAMRQQERVLPNHGETYRGDGIQPGSPVLSDEVAFPRMHASAGGPHSPLRDHAGPHTGVNESRTALYGQPTFPAGVSGSMPGGSLSAREPQRPAEGQANGSLEARVGLLECQIIEDSLRRNNHRRKETAAELGISRVTLYNKMKKFGLL